MIARRRSRAQAQAQGFDPHSITDETLKHIVISVAALLLSGAASVQAPTISVQHREDAWASAFNRRDVPALAAAYAADAWLVLPGAPPVKGRAAISDALRKLRSSVVGIELRATSVVSLGPNVAVENGVANVQPGIGKQTQASNYIVIWHRTRGGEWQILRDVVSPR